MKTSGLTGHECSEIFSKYFINAIWLNAILYATYAVTLKIFQLDLKFSYLFSEAFTKIC